MDSRRIETSMALYKLYYDSQVRLVNSFLKTVYYIYLNVEFSARK